MTSTIPQRRVSYDAELDELHTTYAAALGEDPRPLRRQLLCLAAGPARFIGTGGTLPLAQLAASLQEQLSGQPARAVTPLDLQFGAPLARCGALLFSARARHPDARLALRRLGAGDYKPAVLVTHRDPAELATDAGPGIAVVQIRAPAIREGFLATNSVLGMATLLVRAATATEPPGDLLAGAGELPAPALPHRPRILVVHPPSLAAVATDLETRCSELGLAAVQTADLRNVAHGRHTGLARRAEETTVLVLSDRGSGELATAVGDVLARSGAEQLRWHAELDSGPAALRLLAASMTLTGQLAGAQDLDAARPAVPGFGRRLYHLPLTRLLARPPEGPVSRKLLALGAGTIPPRLQALYRDAYADWARELAAVRIGSLALDYDGTVCFTSRRTSAPGESVQAELLRVLDAGLAVGFASGRGRSLHADLRAWVPERLWPQITLALYNGAVRVALADELADLRQPSPVMAQVAQRLREAPLGELVELTARAGQVTVHARDEAFFHAGRLPELVRDVLARDPALAVKTVASGHSVDVVAADTSKASILEHLGAAAPGKVLAVGDQGDTGGNDFELLAATRWSISVDRCSADPTRCWSADAVGRRGPDALVALLRSLRLNGPLGRLDVRGAGGGDA